MEPVAQPSFSKEEEKLNANDTILNNHLKAQSCNHVNYWIRPVIYYYLGYSILAAEKTVVIRWLATPDIVKQKY